MHSTVFERLTESPLLLPVLAVCALLLGFAGLLFHGLSNAHRRRRASSGGESQLLKLARPRRANRYAEEVARLAETGQFEALKKLIDKGEADPNQKDPRSRKMSIPILVTAIGKGHVKIAQLLMEQPGIDFNLSRVDGTTALIMAASRGHEAIVRELLKRSRGTLDINACNSNKSTALIVSARAGHALVVKMLIDAGADRLHAQYTGLSALHFSSRDGHFEIVEYILRGAGDAKRRLLDAQDKHEFTPLMYSCQRDHYKVARLLLENTEQLDRTSKHGTALHVAAIHNSCKLMAVLIESGKVDNLFSQRDFKGRTALELARIHHSKDCELLLHRNFHAQSQDLMSNTYLERSSYSNHELSEQAALTTEQFSLKLYERMRDSGFCRRRAVFQAGAADLLAKLGNTSELRGRFDKRKASGSFADGWGSSLQRLNGSLASSSDVDMSVQRNDPVHIEGTCSGEGDCRGVQTHQLENGFLRLQDVSGDKPSKTDLAVGVRPSMDYCSFRPCCRSPLELQESISKLPAGRFQFPKDPEIEFVRSVRPECSDQMEMRISCTSLEKETLRQLKTAQGQVFVIIKYIFKHIISAGGLKSYISKSLMFFLLCEIPDDCWKKERLEWLVSKALLRFEDFVKCSEEHGSSKCMPHFFISDAWVYFKAGTSADRSAILSCLQSARRNLRSILTNYMENHLQPLRQGRESPFVFYPFVLVELVTPFTRPMIPLTEYPTIYPMVFKILEDIGNPGFFVGDSELHEAQLESLTRDIDSLPKCAETAREVLRVLMYLKFGCESSALQVLTDARGIQTRRCIDFNNCQTPDDAKRCILDQLMNRNSAWKFCFYFNRDLNFQFLPERMRCKLGGPASSNCGFYQLPGHILLDFTYFVNFDAILKSLCLCLIPSRCPDLVSQWFLELNEVENSDDIYELFLFAKFANDSEQLRHCLHRMKLLTVNLDEESEMIDEVQGKLTGLEQQCHG